MRFTPRTEEEVQQYKLIEPGVYSFEVVGAQDKFSRAGTEMIELKLKVWDNNGKERLVFDYLLEALDYKVRHFCYATGIGTKYEDGTLQAEDCFFKTGKVDIYIAKDKTGKYPDKNAVKDYVVMPEGIANVMNPALAKQEEVELNDDIPF